MLRTTLILILGLISANIYGISAIALPFKLSNELEIDNHPCKAENIKVSVKGRRTARARAEFGHNLAETGRRGLS